MSFNLARPSSSLLQPGSPGGRTTSSDQVTSSLNWSSGTLSLLPASSTLQKSDPILPRYGTTSSTVTPRLSLSKYDVPSTPDKSYLSRTPDRGYEDGLAQSPGHISERQVKWDREADEVDRKQAETFQMQWSLIREQISTLSRDLLLVRSEVKSLIEVASKVPEIGIAVNEHTDLLKELVDEPRLRREADAKLEEDLRVMFTRLSEALAMEERAREDGDDELNRAHHNAKGVNEKEARDRALGQEEIYSRLQALQGALEDESQARQSGDDGLRSSVANNRQELVTLKGERVEEESTMKRAIQGLEGALAVQFKELRGALEAEVHERNLADGRLDKGSGDLRSKLEAEADSRTRLAEDITKNFIELQNGLEQEARKRGEEDGLIAEAISKIREFEEAEAKERERNEGELADRLRGLADTMQAEGRERAMGDDELKKELINTRNLLENEVKLRIAGDKECTEALRGEGGKHSARAENDKNAMLAVVNKVGQELDNIKDGLAKEAAERKSADETLSRIEGRLKSDLATEVTARKEGDTAANYDLREGLRQLSEALGDEARARAAGDEDSGKGMGQMKQFFDKEARDREAANNTLAGHVKDLFASLDQEKGDREKADGILREQVMACHHDVVGAKNALGDEDAALKRGLQALEVALAQQSKELRTGLEAEGQERGSADRRLESLYAELHKAFGMESQSRKVGDEELEKLLRSLRNELENEARQRVAGDDSAQQAIKSEAAARAAGDQGTEKMLNEAMLKVENALDGAQDAIRKEALDRMAADDQLKQADDKLQSELKYEVHLREDQDKRLGGEMRDALNKHADALAAENKDRLSTHEKLGEGTRGLKGMLEKEARDRAGADEELAKNLQTILQALDQEKADREHGDASLRGQLRDEKQDLDREKAERADGMTALRDALRGLEGQILPRLQDIGGHHEAEKAERLSVDKRHETLLNDLRAALEAEATARGRVADEADNGLRSLRANLEQEAKIRGNDDEALRDAIKAEIGERISADDTCMTRLNNLVLKVEAGQDDMKNLLRGEFSIMSTKLSDLKFAG